MAKSPAERARDYRERKTAARDRAPVSVTPAAAVTRAAGHAGHSLYPHDHVPGTLWCSGRFWCDTCRTWNDGPACSGRRIAQLSVTGAR
jgi:hypothetical protein